MFIAFLALLGVAAIGWAIAIFLGTEFLKKFRFMWEFQRDSRMLVNYMYPGSERAGNKPGMRNIVLRGDRPFAALVGFRLEIPVITDRPGHPYEGFDYYGFVRSDEHGVAVISTYMGKGACEFLFFVNTDLGTNQIVVLSTDADQALTPGAVYPPHWYQKVGFYG